MVRILLILRLHSERKNIFVTYETKQIYHGYRVEGKIIPINTLKSRFSSRGRFLELREKPLKLYHSLKPIKITNRTLFKKMKMYIPKTPFSRLYSIKDFKGVKERCVVKT